MTINILNVREKKDSVGMYLMRTGSDEITKPKEERYRNMLQQMNPFMTSVEKHNHQV